MENTFFQRLMGSSSFVNKYYDLLCYSVCSQFPTLRSLHYNRDIDWNYLITCASLLSQSTGGKEQDAAFRICQTCISISNCDEQTKSVAASILNILTNMLVNPQRCTQAES